MILPSLLSSIGIARGCSGCTCTPGQRKEIFRHKFVSASLSRASHFFNEIFCCAGRFGGSRVVHLIVLACVLRLMTKKIKKGRQLFLRKKVHPQRNSWLCLCFQPKIKSLT